MKLSELENRMLSLSSSKWLVYIISFFNRHAYRILPSCTPPRTPFQAKTSTGIDFNFLACITCERAITVRANSTKICPTYTCIWIYEHEQANNSKQTRCCSYHKVFWWYDDKVYPGHTPKREQKLPQAILSQYFLCFLSSIFQPFAFFILIHMTDECKIILEATLTYTHSPIYGSILLYS